MEIVFFTYTVIVMMMCAVAGTVAAATYVVSRHREYLFTCTLFVFYLFDLSLIFQAEYLYNGGAIYLTDYYAIDSPMVKTFFALGVLESIWLLVCHFLDKKNPVLLIGPAVAFVVFSFLITWLMPEGPFRQWLFYSQREAYMLWCIGYSVACYFRTKDPVRKAFMKRQFPLILVSLLLILCIIVENTVLIFLWNPIGDSAKPLLVLFFSERNISENVLIMVYAIVAIKVCFDCLKFRGQAGPSVSSANDSHLELVLPSFCTQHHLTPREREILVLIVQGKDYQNIASALQLAPGTVKSHTHNILKKTECTNRTELLQKFWSR